MKASELLEQSAAPFDEACILVREMENEIERLRAGIRLCHGALMDSVETHGTHGGWLHDEARMLHELLTPNATDKGSA